MRRYNERLHNFLPSLPTCVHAVVVDSRSKEAICVAKRLGIPGYTLFTASASTFAAFTQLIADASLEIFGLPAMPASQLFGEMLGDPESGTYKTTVDVLRRIPETDGTLVNTFESLEARTVAALRDPLFIPGRVLPPVYCVGPFVGTIGDAEAGEPRHESLAWLDGQPDGSVVFLYFGSVSAGNHSEEQLREIAVGLEESGHRFLWVVRAPIPRVNPDLDALLPEGFLERTNGHGLVVKLRAPQVDVFHHRATRAFVTHCGWNSVLEGVTAGVPMLCLPLYAEQKMNKLLMVGDMRIGVEMNGWQDGLVKAAEVECRIRLVMESKEGMELRARAAAHKEGAATACNDGGSSRLALAQFLADMDNRQDRASSETCASLA